MLCGGCYLSHEVVPSEDGGRDAGRDARADAGADAPHAGDAGIDARVRCALQLEAESAVALDEDGNAYAPDIFWSGERIGVVVSEDNAGGFEHGTVSATHTHPALTEAVRALRVVGEDSHGWGEAAWNGEGFGLCWSGDPAGQSGTHFREVSGLEGALGPRTYLGEGSEACFDMVFAHGRYALARRQLREGGRIETLVQVLGRDGVRAGEPLSMGTAEYPGHSATLGVTDSGFIAVSNVGEEVRLLRFDRDGVVTSDQRVGIPGIFTSFASRGDQIALLTATGERETSPLLLTVLDESLRTVFSRSIADGAPTTSTPRVHAMAEGWLLVWGEGSRPSYRAMMLSLDEEGLPTAPRRVLYAGPHSDYGGPSIVSGGDATFVGISHQLPGTPDGGRQFTYVQRWTCGEDEDLCRAQDARAEDAADCTRSVVLGWRFDGSACVPLFDCDTGCEGADCDHLAVSRFACESDRRECLDSRRCVMGALAVDEVCGPVQVSSERPSWLEAHFGGDASCVCEEPTCEVSVTGPFTLRASLAYCVDEVPDCDCGTPREHSTPCVLPPLAPGTWTLELDGREPLTLESRRGTIETSDACR